MYISFITVERRLSDVVGRSSISGKSIMQIIDNKSDINKIYEKYNMLRYVLSTVYYLHILKYVYFIRKY